MLLLAGAHVLLDVPHGLVWLVVVALVARIAGKLVTAKLVASAGLRGAGSLLGVALLPSAPLP